MSEDDEFLELINEGLELLEEKAHEESIDCFNAAKEIDPTSELPYMYIALVQMELQQLEEAIENLTQALSLTTESHDMYNNLIDICQMSLEHSKKSKEFKQEMESRMKKDHFDQDLFNEMLDYLTANLDRLFPYMNQLLQSLEDEENEFENEALANFSDEVSSTLISIQTKKLEEIKKMISEKQNLEVLYRRFSELFGWENEHRNSSFGFLVELVEEMIKKGQIDFATYVLIGYLEEGGEIQEGDEEKQFEEIYIRLFGLSTESDDYDLAIGLIPILDNVEFINIDDPRLIYYMALLSIKYGDYDKGLENLRECLEVDASYSHNSEKVDDIIAIVGENVKDEKLANELIEKLLIIRNNK